MNRGLVIGIIIAVVAVLLGVASVFTVSEDQFAIKFQMGKFESADYPPGIHTMWPVVNTVHKFDKRIQTLELTPEQFMTQDKKGVIVAAFIKWRIVDVVAFDKASSGEVNRAANALLQTARDRLRIEFGKRTLAQVIADQRAEATAVAGGPLADQTRQFGAELVEVRLSRVELPNDISNDVYKRMQSERSNVASEVRAKATEAADRIKADADRQRTVIVAEAYRDAQRIRGDGDAKAAAIYARAFSKNQEFFKLYRSLDAYKNVFKSPQDVLVLDPNSDFFRYFKNPNGR